MAYFYPVLYLLLALTQIIHSAEDFGTISSGGTPAAKGQFQFTARVYKTQSNFYSCSGTIIDQQWIVTAAACIAGEDTVTVAVGGINVNYTGDADSVVVKSAKLYPHPKFSINKLIDHNIGLIKLEKPLQFNDLIQKAELGTEFLKADLEGVVAGWGYNSPSEPNSRQLLFRTVSILSDSDCQSKYPNVVNNSNEFCAASVDTTLCQSDLGAGLVLNPSNKPLLVGVVYHYTRNQCNSGVPSIFTRVSVYRDWIKQTIDRNTNSACDVKFSFVIYIASVVAFLLTSF